jgi:uncharacterized protein involved in exopolysaccharide biosynthesis
MDIPAPPLLQVEDDTTLKDLICRFWRVKGRIALTAIVMAAVALAPAYVVPKRYTARTLIAIVPPDARRTEFGVTNSKLSGVATVLGLSPQSIAARAEALGTLSSDLLMEQYIQNQHLVPVLTQDETPTLWLATRRFARIRAVSADEKTGIITVAATWNDPKVAAKWANDLVTLANDHMRDRAVREANANIAYLRGQIDTASSLEMKKELYTLLQNEIKNEMLAAGTREFAFKVIDPALPPEKQTWPKPLFWAIGGFFGGILIALCYLSDPKRP